MKKEKKIKAHTRRTKSGKTITVKAHTAKYDAADELKKAAKKKGAGDELEKRRVIGEYPKNYEWIEDIPDADLSWFTDVVAMTTDNTEAYDQKSRKALAKFFSNDMGPKMGADEKYRYLAAKKLGVNSEDSYRDKWEEIDKLATKMRKKAKTAEPKSDKPKADVKAPKSSMQAATNYSKNETSKKLKLRKTLNDYSDEDLDYAPKKDIKKVAKVLGLTDVEAASWVIGPNFTEYKQSHMNKGEKKAKKYLGKEIFDRLDPSSPDSFRAVLDKARGKKL